MESQMLLVLARKGQWLADLFQMSFHMVSSQCDQRHGFIPPQVLDLNFPLVRLLIFLLFHSPVCQGASSSTSDGSRPICCICHFPSSVLCAHFLRELFLTVQVIGKDVKQYQPQSQSLGLITSDWSPDGLQAAEQAAL